PVDDGHIRVLRQLLDVLVRERADHDAVDVTRQHSRRVSDRLAATELNVARRKKERVSAELERADLERDAGARARLPEDHGERPSRQRLFRVLPRAHRLGEREQTLELRAGEIRDGQEIGGCFGHARKLTRTGSAAWPPTETASDLP